ncbi:solute carrier family 23 protein, partial [Pseudomonas aeruginosa]|uniref:solute carrier family 23 protein n=1 Tax=Pseudomonas aeruginosa TaxID=287 RepID=UPI003009C11D
IVMIIGLNLAPVTIKGVAGQPFEMWMALITVLCMGSIAVFTRGLLQRLLLLVGLILAYVIYAMATNGLGLGKPIDFSQISQASWFGIPNFSHPTFDTKAILIIAPVALILV